MSDDVAFLAALTLGIGAALVQLVTRRLPRRLHLTVAGWTAAVLVGGFALDAVQHPTDPLGHRGDTASLVALGFLMLVPIWGFFDERLLERIDDLAVAVVTLAFAYRAADHVPPLATGGVTLVGLVLVVMLRGRTEGGSWWWAIAAYTWFLASAVALACIEFGDVSGPLVDSIDELPPWWLSAASGGAMLWLAFHAWFALKFTLVLTTLTRSAGRHHARLFARRVVASRATPLPVLIVTVGAASAVLGADRLVGLGDDRLVGASAVLLVPLAGVIRDRRASRAVPVAA